ncbi:MAG: tetratricopeptide repeat protein [Burkholderiaceae bacterium]
MHQYGVRDVEKLLRLSRSTIRSLIDAGFVNPKRGPRNAWLFSFQDLIVLRTARALAVANVPHKRITRSIRQLRRHLPDAMPLSGLSISAVADRVVVNEGGSRWQAESGQYLLAFESDANGAINVIENGQPRELDARSRFSEGVALESQDADAALQAYSQAVAADPSLVDAQINLGRLLHEGGDLQKAERVYRNAIEACSGDPLLHYNLGVLLEDMGRKAEAVEAYEAALRGDPSLADCHYNVALLYEDLKKPKDAIRHMAQYRRLLGTQRPGY